ncbi:hypothetical protein ACSBR2_015468 [Camellia fascicularis]
MAKKPSMGHQKIKIAKIEIKNHLQVTFSKHRSRLFKKAFSPAGKVFSFGHPNVDSIVNRFLLETLHQTPPQATSSRLFVAKDSWWEAPIDELGLHELEQLRNSMMELKNMTKLRNSMMELKNMTN